VKNKSFNRISFRGIVTSSTSISDNKTQCKLSIFKEHISTSATIITDKWRGYEPLKENYNIEQIYSNNGANFKQLHIVIMQVKSWLRAIPTHVSKWHIQAYFDEFCFRINRSKYQKSIFHKTIETMILNKPIYQNQIKQNLNV
jgi:transposase-like protein